MATRVKFSRVDTASNFTSANPVLASGEITWESDTERAKVGDGVTAYNLLPYRFEGVSDHGDLTGLGDDDHLQYLNESRHDSLPSDNPHGVTAAQTGADPAGSAASAQAFAIQRANHTGTQTASTISDFDTEVSNNADVTSNTAKVSADGSIDTHSDVDTTSSAPTPGQNLQWDGSNWVPVTPSAGVTDHGLLTGLADDDHLQYLTEARHDALPSDNPHSVTSAQVGADPVGSAASAQAFAIQRVNHTGTQTASTISDFDAEVSNNPDVTSNTAKVSADGPVSTHSDVNTTGAASGDQLEFNGTTWVPMSVLNGFTVFPIWAEENAALGSAQYEWSFGNGATGANIGVPVGIDCELFAVSFNAETFGTSCSIDTEIDGVAAATSTFTVNNTVDNFTAIPATAGSRIGFRTNTVTGGFTDARVCAWFRLKATAVFPTPDRSVVQNTGIAFSAVAFADVPGMTTTVTLTDDGEIDASMTYSALRSGATNAVTDFRVVINGDNGFSFTDTLSTFNDNGTVTHNLAGLSAGTYTVTGQCQTTEPITISSVALIATAIED